MVGDVCEIVCGVREVVMPYMTQDGTPPGPIFEARCSTMTEIPAAIARERKIP